MTVLICVLPDSHKLGMCCRQSPGPPSIFYLFSPACWELGFQAWAQGTCRSSLLRDWFPCAGAVCGGGGAPRDSAGSGATEEGLTSRGGTTTIKPACSRTHALQQEKPPQREAQAWQLEMGLALPQRVWELSWGCWPEYLPVACLLVLEIGRAHV